MLKKPTVLVLDAGASAPFDYPTGVQLSNLVYSSLAGEGHEAYKVVKNICGHTDSEIIAFRDSFFFSGKNSVDAFLEHRTQYVPIGKAVTAAILIPFEKPYPLFKYSENNWLRYIYNNLVASFDSFGDNQLSIVTFNYDRTVEHFFFTSLKNTYDRSNEETSRVLEQIPIIHLHGSLGSLPWQSDLGRAYSYQVDKAALSKAIDGIKIIHEDIKDGRDKEFQRAKTLMGEAEKVLFMGFGYNRTNLERLGIANLDRDKAIGTCMGLSNQEQSSIKRACDGKVSFVTGDCIEFVRERIDWD